jgi:glycosyltransferase involved in cell wall biosynthesis
MRLLCVDQYGSIGGAQRCLLDLLPAFVDRQWSVSIAAPDSGPLLSLAKSFGCPVLPLSTSRLSSYQKSAAEMARYAGMVPSWAIHLRRAAQSSRAELIYVNGPRVLPPAAFVARLKAIPLVFHAHHRLTQLSAIRLTRAALNLSRASVIACSRFVAESFDGFGGRVTVIYNGSPDLASRSGRRRNDHPNIGVIGRIDREKGQLDFVRAAQLVHGVMPNVRFTVVGSPQFGNENYYRQVVEESRTLPITFVGWTDRVDEALAEFDVLVVPSPSTEATPRIILEAFSAGVPVVSFRSEGIAEILKSRETGFLVETRSPAALAGMLCDVLRTYDDTVERVISSARLAWEREFRLDRFQRDVCNRLEAEYQHHASGAERTAASGKHVLRGRDSG